MFVAEPVIRRLREQSKPLSSRTARHDVADGVIVDKERTRNRGALLRTLLTMACVRARTGSHGESQIILNASLSWIVEIRLDRDCFNSAPLFTTDTNNLESKLCVFSYFSNLNIISHFKRISRDDLIT